MTARKQNARMRMEPIYITPNLCRGQQGFALSSCACSRSSTCAVDRIASGNGYARWLSRRIPKQFFAVLWRHSRQDRHLPYCLKRCRQKDTLSLIGLHGLGASTDGFPALSTLKNPGGVAVEAMIPEKSSFHSCMCVSQPQNTCPIRAAQHLNMETK